MSIINSLLFAASEQALLNSGHADEFIVLTGTAKDKRFEARLDLEPVMTVDESGLYPDPRMQSVIRIAQPAPVTLALNDCVQMVGGKQYKVIKMENNDTTVTIDYYVEQQL